MKVKFLIAALFFSLVAAAQPSNYIKFNTRGRWIAGMFDSTLHVPRFNGSPSLRTGGSSMDGAIAIDTTNSIMYFYSGGTWNRANISIPTLQQVLTAGSNLTSSHTININNNDFIIEDGNTIQQSIIGGVNSYILLDGNFSRLYLYRDSILINPSVGNFLIDTLNYTLSTTGKKILIRDTATGLVQNIDPSLLGGGSTPTFQQVLTAGSTLTGNNTIDFNTNTLTFNTNGGYFDIETDDPGNVVQNYKITGEPSNRLQIQGDGLLEWGDGTGADLIALQRWKRNGLGLIDNNVKFYIVDEGATDSSKIIFASGGDTSTFSTKAAIYYNNTNNRFGFITGGNMYIDDINYTLSTTGKKILIRDTATGLVQNIDPSLLGASSYTFTNGLTNSSGTVKLGGDLVNSTSINGKGSYSVTLDSLTGFTVKSPGLTKILTTSTQAYIYGNSSSTYMGVGTELFLAQQKSGNSISMSSDSFVLKMGGNSQLIIRPDSLNINPPLGIAIIDTLAAASNMTNKRVMTWDTVTKRWEQISKDSVGGGGSTSPAGSDTYVQFNDGGSFGGDAGLSYNKTDNELKINTSTDNGAYKLQGEGGMYWKLDGTNAFKIVHSVGADRVTINGSTGNLDSYTFSSQNFSTSSAGSSTFNGSYMRQSGGAYFQGWQQPFSMIRTYPGTGSSPQSTVIFDNTTETSPASDYQIATFKLSGTSVAFVDKDGKYNAQSTVTAGGTTGNQTINKPTGTVNIAAAGSTVTVTNSTCTANSIVYAVLRTNDATATGIKSVVPSAGSFVITLNAAATAEVSVGFIVFN